MNNIYINDSVIRIKYLLFILVTSLGTSVFGQTEIDFLMGDLSFDTISKTQFDSFLVISTSNTDASFLVLGIEEITQCDQICETFLKDTLTGKTMWLPSNFDQGVLGISFSPTGKQFLVFSSYDDPLYEDYYDYRAEFFVFSIANTKGLDSVKLSFNYFITEWSIDDLIWVTENTLALKTYTESRWGDGSQLNYKYLVVEIN